MTEFNLSISSNLNGKKFVSKWEKDTKISMYLIAPAILLTCFLGSLPVFGLTIQMFAIMIFPFILVVIGLIYSPYFLRKAYINQTITALSQNNDKIKIVTFRWFSFRSIQLSLSPNDLQVSKLKQDAFFKPHDAFLITIGSGSRIFYLVPDFFDNKETISAILALPDLAA